MMNVMLGPGQEQSLSIVLSSPKARNLHSHNIKISQFRLPTLRISVSRCRILESWFLHLFN